MRSSEVGDKELNNMRRSEEGDTDLKMAEKDLKMNMLPKK